MQESGKSLFAQEQDVAGQNLAGQEPAQKAADVIDVTLTSFRADVMEESMNRLVLIDFWSARVPACKQLAPVVEKVVMACRGKVRLARMNVDEFPQIAAKLGIQSVPAIVAFQGGQMLDGFMGVMPENEIMAFIERCIGPVGVDVEALVAEGLAALDAGDIDTATDVLVRAAQEEPEHIGLRAGFARLHLARGFMDEARAVLDAIPPNKALAAPVVAARAALELQEQAAAVGDLAALQARIAANPADHQARYDLAVGLNAAGQRAEAAEQLLASFKLDRLWNDDAARKLLLQLFESWGPADPAALAARRRLSTLLFS